MRIDSFSGHYGFLSNFHPSPFSEGGIVYPAVENYFQAAKAQTRVQHETVARLGSPRAAKLAGRGVALRPDWEEVKLAVMRRALELKFTHGGILALQLLDTHPYMLVEGNTWGDTFWGQVNGYGLNWLGHLLMARRGELFE